MYCGCVHFQQWLFIRVLIIWFRSLDEKITPFLITNLMSKHIWYSHKCKNCLKKTVSSGNVQSCNNDVRDVNIRRYVMSPF